MKLGPPVDRVVAFTDASSRSSEAILAVTSWASPGATITPRTAQWWSSRPSSRSSIVVPRLDHTGEPAGGGVFSSASRKSSGAAPFSTSKRSSSSSTCTAALSPGSTLPSSTIRESPFSTAAGSCAVEVVPRTRGRTPLRRAAAPPLRRTRPRSAGPQPAVEPVEQEPRDGEELLFREGAEDDDLVDPVDELRAWSCRGGASISSSFSSSKSPPWRANCWIRSAPTFEVMITSRAEVYLRPRASVSRPSSRIWRGCRRLRVRLLDLVEAAAPSTAAAHRAGELAAAS